MTDHVTTQTAVVATLPDGTQIAVDQLPTGELVQIVKLYDGAADSTNAASVSAAGALKVDGSAVTQPVSGPLTDAQLRASAVPVTGPLTLAQFVGATENVTGSVAVTNFPATQPVSAAALPLPTGASTEATLALIKAKTDNIDVALSTRTKPADTQKVDGSAVTQPVSGPLTDAQLRATPVPVSGTVTITDGSGPVTVDGTVAVSNFPATQPISAVALPLPAGAATDASLTTLDTDLKAEIGVVGPAPSAYTVLDRLSQNGRKLDALTSSVATEATLKKLLAALSKPVAPSYSTLLHR